MLLTKIWKRIPGKYFFLCTKSRAGKWEDHSFKRSEFDQIPQFIKEHMDKDVYWCVHGFNKPRRLKEYAEIPKMLWADLDAVNPTELGDLQPSVAWQSSPGRYCGIWFIDNYMTESLNKALTNHIRADPGGWDLTQVLRVPGTKNYKYPEAPLVKTLWSDGDDYTTKQIQNQLPKSVEKTTNNDPTDAKAIYRKHERKFNTFIRRELMYGKPKEGKRSEVLWKLANEIIECGVSKADTFELLRISPWNKFRDRKDGDKQLRREIDKITDHHIDTSVNGKKTYKEVAKETDKEPEEPYPWLSRSMADIEDEEIEWVWDPYLARQQVTILEGDPDTGKSYMAMMIAGHIVDQKALPSPHRRPVKGKVCYFDVENSLGAVMKKRLKSNNVINLKDFIPEGRAFTVGMEDMLEAVNDAIEKIKPILCVFDTINHYIEGDTNKANDVTQMMKHFTEMAKRHNCAVLLLRHLTKDKNKAAIYQGQGSIAFTGVARMVMTVAKHPLWREDEDYKEVKVMAMTKNNLSEKPPGLTYLIQKVEDSLTEFKRSKFIWGDFIDMNADDLINIPPPGKGQGPNPLNNKTVEKARDIEEWLLSFLDDGPKSKERILKAGEARGFSEKSLSRAGERLGVIKGAEGFGSKRKAIWAIKPAKKKSELDEED